MERLAELIMADIRELLGLISIEELVSNQELIRRYTGLAQIFPAY